MVEWYVTCKGCESLYDTKWVWIGEKGFMSNQEFLLSSPLLQLRLVSVRHGEKAATFVSSRIIFCSCCSFSGWPLEHQWLGLMVDGTFPCRLSKERHRFLYQGQWTKGGWHSWYTVSWFHQRLWMLSESRTWPCISSSWWGVIIWGL